MDIKISHKVSNTHSARYSEKNRVTRIDRTITISKKKRKRSQFLDKPRNLETMRKVQNIGKYMVYAYRILSRILDMLGLTDVLNDLTFPFFRLMIKSEKSLLKMLRLSKSLMDDLVGNPDKYHYPKRIPKNDGTYRILYPCKGRLKEVQKKIKIWLLSIVKPRDYQYGGIRGKDNIQNARFHQGNKYIFNTDIVKFFDRVSCGMVYDAFFRIGCSPSVARRLTQLTTYKGNLGQGGHASNIIANLVFVPCGDDIDSFCKIHGFKFTTFVDDIVVSSRCDFKEKISDILDIIRRYGFEFHPRKTSYKVCLPMVTGILVGNNGLKPTKRIMQSLDDAEDQSARCRGLNSYIERILTA